MRRIISSGLILALMALMTFSIHPGDGTPTRDENVDIEVSFLAPWEGGSYGTEDGLNTTLVLSNLGTTWANLTGSAQLTVKNYNTGDAVWKPLSRPFTGIPPGQNITMNYTTWRPTTGGKFQAEVFVTYFGDKDYNNNKDIVNFTLKSQTWQDDPKLETGSVTPILGDTSTLFTYKVYFIHNDLPDSITVEIDGTNYTMDEADPDDLIAEDGKEYTYKTTLNLGNHDYRFFAFQGALGIGHLNNMTMTGPWVNLTLNTADLLPNSGFITTNFLISVFYGSSANEPPDEIYAMIAGNRYDLSRTALTPIYTSGRIEFQATVAGIDLIPSPVMISYHCSLGTDQLSLGPFPFDGPSMLTSNITGHVRDADGSPIPGATVKLEPGEETVTDSQGVYSIPTFEGRGFSLVGSAEGYQTKTYTGIDIYPSEDRIVDVELQLPPVGATLSGRVLSMLDGDLVGVEGITVSLSGTFFSDTVSTNITGHFILEDIPGEQGYLLSIEQHPYLPYSSTLNIQNGQSLFREIVLTEKDMDIGIFPAPGEIPLDAEFEIRFGRPIDTMTLDVGTVPPLNMDILPSNDNTTIRLVPLEQLLYGTEYSLIVGPGVMDTEGISVVWREVWAEYSTVMQELPSITVDPAPDSIDVPLQPVIRMLFSTAVNHSTFNATLRSSAEQEVGLPINVTISDDRNMSDHGRRTTSAEISCPLLAWESTYVLILTDDLLDIYGRKVLERHFIMEFRTVGEPDRDGDGVPDGRDAFPDDPAASVDSDGDGYPDFWNPGKTEADSTTGLKLDAFPDDPNEWNDTDGDGIGDNSDPDIDGDGMPNEWEGQYGLDPYDPSDAFGDLDGDGFTNLQEYLAGTNPTDPKDYPREGTSFGSIKWLLLAVIVLLIVVGVFFLIRFKRSPAFVEE
ncbi:MAG: carboxypeptidase regulatory-like domain-containing protein [Candidatus Thermoplasmatota archaeon]|nr:carboxypeptidase regulatory-like domain-containing protein [Candidatus Thermoplasmatota archaeon]